MKLYIVDNMLFTESNHEISMRLSYLLKVRKVQHLFLNGKVDEIVMDILKLHEECNLYLENEICLEDMMIRVEDEIVSVNGQESVLDAGSVLIYDTDTLTYERIYINLFLNHSISEGFIDHFVKELQEALQDNLGNVTVKKIK